MRHDARLSSAVPHSTAFLPPAFMATLPPMHDAWDEVGSTANTKPAFSAASDTLLVITPAPELIVAYSCVKPGKTCISTAPRVISFSVLMTADIGVKGIAPPV